MTYEMFAERLRPLATELAEKSDEDLPRDTTFAKAMLCLLMGMADQMTPAERSKLIDHVAIHLAPIYNSLANDEEKSWRMSGKKH
jgi:hypothetical protein